MAAAISSGATLLALALMFVVRLAYQVRSLPERVMEASLALVPLGLFEALLQRFAGLAKEIALWADVVGLAAILILLGSWALRRGTTTIGVTAGGLWLFAMAVVMPITGAGFFAADLPTSILLTNLSYLGVALAYGSVLLVGRWWLLREASPAASPTAVSGARRAFLGSLAGAGVAYVAAIGLGRPAPSPLPAALPASSPAPPTPALPTVAPTPDVAAAPPASTIGAVAEVGATPTLPPTVTPLPTATSVPVVPPAPSPLRSITHAKDGSLLATRQVAGQVAPLYTANSDFYITTKNAISDPVLDPQQWRLTIDGEVARPAQLDLPGIYQLPAVTVTLTLECISNWVASCGEVPFGCDLIGNATWKGVRLSDLLAAAGGLKAGAATIVAYAADEYNAAIPTDPALLHDTLLVYAMNDSVLPLEHGYPARLLVPNRFGMKSPKWVVRLHPVQGSFVDWYGRLGWSKEAIVPAMTRIDVPANGAHLAPGLQTIAGIAYAGNRGVSQVEFSVDGGHTWQPAHFQEPALAPTAWVRWEGQFTLPAGASLNLVARCVDGTGARQVASSRPTQPDGATGLDTITIKSA